MIRKFKHLQDRLQLLFILFQCTPAQRKVIREIINLILGIQMIDENHGPKHKIDKIKFLDVGSTADDIISTINEILYVLKDDNLPPHKPYHRKQYECEN